MAIKETKVGTKAPAAAKPVAMSPAKTVIKPAVAAKIAAAKPVIAASPVAPVVIAKPVVAPAHGAAPTPAVVTPAVVSPAVVTPAVVAAPKIAEPVAVQPTPSTDDIAPVEPVAAAPAPVEATPEKKEVFTMENTVNNVTEKTQTMFVEMNDRAKVAMEKTQTMFADMNEFNKGNVEALVESSKIAAKGIEAMGQDAAEYTRKSFESATAIVKSLSAVKSPTEFMKLQSDYVRTSFDALVAESSKSTEMMLKLAGEVAQPISNRIAVAAEKLKINA